MITNNVYGAPPDRSASGALQEALNRLATIDAENLRLRQQLFENRGKHDDLDICYRTLEAELKYAGKKDVEKVEKELNIRVR